MKEIIGYDIIIHWNDGTKEDLDEYGEMPYFKSVDHYLNCIQDEANNMGDDDVVE
jgi:hypothetical protein